MLCQFVVIKKLHCDIVHIDQHRISDFGTSRFIFTSIILIIEEDFLTNQIIASFLDKTSSIDCSHFINAGVAIGSYIKESIYEPLVTK